MRSLALLLIAGMLGTSIVLYVRTVLLNTRIGRDTSLRRYPGIILCMIGIGLLSACIHVTVVILFGEHLVRAFTPAVLYFYCTLAMYSWLNKGYSQSVQGAEK